MTDPRETGPDTDFLSQDLPMAKDSFRGKTVLVTGGGSGIGKATAWLFARLGARIVIIGRTLNKLKMTVSALEKAGFSARYRVTDIRDYDDVGLLYDELFTDCGGLDVLVNNAGGQFPAPALEFSRNGWDAVINNNLNGTWYMMHHAARRWRDRNLPGVIVNVVAVVTRGMYGGAHTCAARAGVIYASKTVAVEWAEYGIRVNCVAPGVINSEGMAVYSSEAVSSFAKSNPMKRFGSPWDVAQSCAFLAGSSGAFINGEVLTVDGGGQLWGDLWMAGRPEYFS